MSDKDTELSPFLTACLKESVTLTEEEREHLFEESTEEHMDKLRATVRRKDRQAADRPRNQYKNNYYRD